ncbi:MAG TPA: class I SAM-dependent methyltransferase, partial [Thermoanaerobaculia bacterium]|nr:class I SAM-dependent methyltransferase [Thermoanaerobaculia bacterium]
AIRLVREQEPPVDARVADLENGEPLPFADRSFDLVLILYYLHRPLVAEARRVLREGGTIVVAVRTKGRFAIEPGELMEHLAGFKVLHHQKGEIEELIAQKV